jgi:hypothetical protein
MKSTVSTVLQQQNMYISLSHQYQEDFSNLQATGLDQIGPQLIKYSTSAILDTITFIISLSYCCNLICPQNMEICKSNSYSQIWF